MDFAREKSERQKEEEERVTVGLFGNSSSEIALNTFGTLAGTTCSFFTLKKDESISRVSVTYTMT